MSDAWRERMVVVLSFILIFAFNSIDNAIAPLVGPISDYFGVPPERALWFISYCAGGTVIGLIFGPSILEVVPAKRCLLYTMLALAGAQVLFAVSHVYLLALAYRFIAGFAAGLVASIMWQLTFHGVSKAFFPAMIAVLMSARPLATALGVPTAGLLAWKVNWQLPVWIIAAFTALSGFWLYRLYPMSTTVEQAAQPTDEGAGEDAPAQANPDAQAEPSPNLFMRVIRPYISALGVPFAYPYYIGSTVNRMAYFGFYAFCGLWFEAHYNLDLKNISLALLIIGLAEALVNFSTNKIIGWFGHKTTFLASLGLSGVILPLFIYGGFELPLAIAMISVFMLLDRVYSMALIISVPKMFPSSGNMTAFGSLNTLTAWGAMSIVSWIQGWMGGYGITPMETMILTCFYVGAAALVYVQKRTVF